MRLSTSITAAALALTVGVTALPGKVPVYPTTAPSVYGSPTATGAPVYSSGTSIDTSCTDESSTVAAYSAKSTKSPSTLPILTTKLKPSSFSNSVLLSSSTLSHSSAEPSVVPNVSEFSSTSCTDETSTSAKPTAIPVYTPKANSSVPVYSTKPLASETTTSTYHPRPAVSETTPAASHSTPSVYPTIPGSSRERTITTTIQSTRTIYSTNYITMTRASSSSKNSRITAHSTSTKTIFSTDYITLPKSTSPATYRPVPAQSGKGYSGKHSTQTLTVYPAPGTSKLSVNVAATGTAKLSFSSTKTVRITSTIPALSYITNSPVYKTVCPKPVAVTVTESCAAARATVTLTETSTVTEATVTLTETATVTESTITVTRTSTETETHTSTHTSTPHLYSYTSTNWYYPTGAAPHYPSYNSHGIKPTSTTVSVASSTSVAPVYESSSTTCTDEISTYTPAPVPTVYTKI